MKKSDFKVFNRPIALELTRKGFSIIETIKNNKDNTKEVYIFEDTKNFRDTFDKVLTGRGFTR